MTLRQTIQAAPAKANELITKLSATSNQAVKAREGLFSELNDELSRYVEIEEQHFLPLLRKHPETKDAAADALKGNKDLRARLAQLAASPKNDDAFIAQLAELKKGFQQHVRNERKELLPAVLKALSDEEARELSGNIEDAVADAEKAKRDEKREEASQVKREAEMAEQARAAQQAIAQAQKVAEREAREATEKVAKTIEQGAASLQENARHVTETITERAQQVASDAREALTVYGGSVKGIMDDLQAVRASSTLTLGAISEFRTVWMDWFGKAARANAEASQRLLRCKSMKEVVELQTETMSGAMRDWMEGGSKLLQIAQRSSKQALNPLDSRLREDA